jgi:hypothetical protein
MNAKIARRGGVLDEVLHPEMTPPGQPPSAIGHPPFEEG